MRQATVLVRVGTVSEGQLEKLATDRHAELGCEFIRTVLRGAVLGAVLRGTGPG